MRALLLCLALSAVASAQNGGATRTFKTLPSSNGYGAVLTDLDAAKLTQLREHLYAVEEPQLDSSGREVWNGNQLQVVKTRDVLYDAYFGLRSAGTQRWLSGTPVLLDSSGYLSYADGKQGGTGMVRWTQWVGALELTTYAFAPRALARAAFVLAIRVKNTSSTPQPGVSVFSLQNYHLGSGRPGVSTDIGENGETVVVQDQDIIERGFAGVVLTRALSVPSRRAAWNPASPPYANGYLAVQNGGSLSDVSGTLGVGDGWAQAFQFDLGDLAPGAEIWSGLVAAHHGDPFSAATLQSELTAYVKGRDAKALVDAERATWSAFQARVRVPARLSSAQEALLRHSATMLAMAQVREESSWVREALSRDGEPRYTQSRAALPGDVKHLGKGALLASLPPGEWTYAWARDAAYAAAALATLGLREEARDALGFSLRAEAGRFQSWTELKDYGLPPYQISLARYLGFGVEETDFNDFGPNLELDGLGLFLWSLRIYGQQTGDATLLEEHWRTVVEKVADPLVALVDPSTGLIRRDSSIWETHWNGRERAWTYTNTTAVRGLCDAAAMALERGDAARAQRYRTTAERLRQTMIAKLTAADGTLASNLEELATGDGYYDAATLEALSMGLFNPRGRIAKATLASLDRKLRVGVAGGWARNDDRTDHAGSIDWSPWGSEYDSAEWVVTDLRGVVALRLAGQRDRSSAVLDWVTRQSAVNDLAIAETYDEVTRQYKFNTPMIGFGAGAYVLALATTAEDPACGDYGDELWTDGGVVLVDGGAVDGGTRPASPPSGCGCNVGGSPLLGLLFLLGLFAKARGKN